MYRAVHADRGGRILVTDHAALAFDGARHVPFADAIPLPPDAVVVALERDAYASEKSGRPRHLGAGRLAAAALLPPGYLRTLLPAYVDVTDRPDLAPRPYAASAAPARASRCSRRVRSRTRSREFGRQPARGRSTSIPTAPCPAVSAVLWPPVSSRSAFASSRRVRRPTRRCMVPSGIASRTCARASVSPRISRSRPACSCWCCPGSSTVRTRSLR